MATKPNPSPVCIVASLNADSWLIAVKSDLSAKIVGFFYGDEGNPLDAGKMICSALKFVGGASRGPLRRDLHAFFEAIESEEDEGVWSWRNEDYDCEGDLLAVALRDPVFVSALLRDKRLPTL